MATPPTLEQVELDIQEIKETLYTLTDLQKLELLEIRKSRLKTGKQLSDVGDRLFQLIMFIMICGAAVLVYRDLDNGSKNKIAESFLSQIIPLGVGCISIHQIYTKTKENAQLRSSASEDQIRNEDVEKYLVEKYVTKDVTTLD